MRVVSRIWRRGAQWALAAGLAMLAVGGCEYGPTVVDATADGKIYHIAFGTGSGPLPGGGFDLSLDFVMDLSVPDAFARATGPLGTFAVMETMFGPYPGFTIAPAIRNSGTDGRAPALRPGNGTPVGAIGLFPPPFAGVGPAVWNLLGVVGGLEPNTVYTVALARMAVEVRGELDQPGKLTGRPDETPDSLYYLGGTPAGNSDLVRCEFDSGIAVTAESNPVALGFIETDANGTAVIDCVPVPVEDSPWWRAIDVVAPAAAADSLPFGRNEPGASLFPGQYNYFLLIPGQGTAENPVPAGPPALRAQVGPDIDATGKVLNNAFAPFPASAMTEAELAVTPGFRGIPGEIRVKAQGLPELVGDARYHAWLYNSEAPERPPVAAVGQLTFVENGNTIPGGTFATWRGGLGVTTVLEVSDATLGGARLRDFDHIAIAVQREGDGAPASPAFWARYVDHNGTPEDLADNRNFPNGELRIGSFRIDAVERSRLFAPGGTLRGSFFRDTLLVSAEGAAVPPAGFHYELWLSAAGGGPSRYIGMLPLDERGFGVFRLPESEVGRFGDYVGVNVTLEANEVPAEPGPYRIFTSEDWTAKFKSVFGSP